MLKFKKHIYLLTTIIFQAALSPAQHYVAIKADIAGAIHSLHIFRPSLEVCVTHRISALVSLEKGKYSEGYKYENGSEQQIYKLSGWGIMPEVRYYILSHPHSPAGFFVGAFMRCRFVNENYKGEDATFHSNSFPYHKDIKINTKGVFFNEGIDLGYKWAQRHFVIEVLGGYGIAWRKWETPNERYKIDKFFKDTEFEPIEDALRIELSIGLLFPGYSFR